MKDGFVQYVTIINGPVQGGNGIKKSDLVTYQALINEMHDTVGRIIGIHVLLLVVEQARWKTGQKYGEAAMILFSEAGISLERLEKLEPERAGLIAHDFFMSIVETLGRLVGSQMARQLMNQLKIDRVEEEANGQNNHRHS